MLRMDVDTTAAELTFEACEQELVFDIDDICCPDWSTWRESRMDQRGVIDGIGDMTMAAYIAILEAGDVA